MRGQMWQRGAEVAFLPARTFEAVVRTDSKRWAEIAKATGAKAE